MQGAHPGVNSAAWPFGNYLEPGVDQDGTSPSHHRLHPPTSFLSSGKCTSLK